MLTHAELMVDSRLDGAINDPDRPNGVSSKVIRCVYWGQRAVAVGQDTGAKTQITALLDLLDLHLSGDGQHEGVEVRPDEVTMLLGGRHARRRDPVGHPGGREAIDAVRTLINAMLSGPSVRLLEPDANGGWSPPTDEPCDLSDVRLYQRWPGLLAAVADQPPRLVAELIKRVGHDALRTYPMLTLEGWWSIRLEGLELGRVCDRSGTLDVGKDSKGGKGRQSPARRVWTSAPGRTAAITVLDDPVSLDAAASAIRDFADTWIPERSASATDTHLEQNEHALESRILRGKVPPSVNGRQLQLLRPDDVVNWGSQFPIKWGRDGSARYLDALLKEGRTPWAIEMKVKGPGGVSQYYRHGIAQAVLYREFIRAAKPLHFWFDKQQLDATACRAAVVVPELSERNARWLPRLQRLCDLFEVTLIQVPHSAAELRVKDAS